MSRVHTQCNARRCRVTIGRRRRSVEASGDSCHRRRGPGCGGCCASRSVRNQRPSLHVRSNETRLADGCRRCTRLIIIDVYENESVHHRFVASPHSLSSSTLSLVGYHQFTHRCRRQATKTRVGAPQRSCERRFARSPSSSCRCCALRGGNNNEEAAA